MDEACSDNVAYGLRMRGITGRARSEPVDYYLDRVGSRRGEELAWIEHRRGELSVESAGVVLGHRRQPVVVNMASFTSSLTMPVMCQILGNLSRYAGQCYSVLTMPPLAELGHARLLLNDLPRMNDCCTLSRGGCGYECLTSTFW